MAGKKIIRNRWNGGARIVGSVLLGGRRGEKGCRSKSQAYRDVPILAKFKLCPEEETTNQ
jgi:hypothetical protein